MAMTPSASLYELSQEYLDILRLLETTRHDGSPDAQQVPGEEEETLAAALDQVDMDIARKAEGICVLIRKFDEKAAFWKAEARRMADGADYYERQAAGLRRYLMGRMLAMDRSSIETSHFRLTIRSTPSINVFDESKVPPEFSITDIKVRVDKLGIRAHLKAGGAMPPGCEMVHSESLVIK